MMNPEEIPENSHITLNDNGYYADDDEATPLLVNSNLVLNKSEIHKEILSRRHSDSEKSAYDDLVDNDTCIIISKSDNDTNNKTDNESDNDTENLQERLRKLNENNDFSKAPSYEQFPPVPTYEQSEKHNNCPTPSAPPAQSVPSAMEMDDLQEVDLNNIKSKDEIDKKNENVMNKLIQMETQIKDLLYPSTQYGYYTMYDSVGIKNFSSHLTFNDINLLPTAYISFNKDNINLETQFTRNIKLKLPIVSSPMDTITEDKMAIKMALLGGIGIIHCNNTPEEQAKMVRKVKNYTNGLVTDAVVFDIKDTIQHVIDTKQKMGYNFSSFPITVGGKQNGILCGLLTKRDIELAKFESERDNKTLSDMKVSDFMRNRANSLIVLNNSTNIEQIKDEMLTHRITKLPITMKQKFYAMACRTDIDNMQTYPNASINPNTKQLLVGAAISTGDGFEKRVKLLAYAGVDVIVIDSSQGCSQYQMKCLLHIKEFYPNIDVICGNVATKFQTYLLTIAGADGIRVGMGSGSICTTQNVTGVGRSQLAAIRICSIAMKTLEENMKPPKQYGGVGYSTVATQNPIRSNPVPIIADGGIKSSGDMVKAFAFGANVIMLGSLIAGTDETPGQIKENSNGFKVKKYRGMGSLEAMSKVGNDRYLSGNSIVAQGVSGEVLAKGPLESHLLQLVNGVKAGLLNIGVSSLSEIPELLEQDRLRYEQKSHSAYMEGNVHSLHNYQY